VAGSALHGLGDVALVTHGQGLARAPGRRKARTGHADDSDGDEQDDPYSSVGV